MDHDLFISYRRGDQVAGDLYQTLKHELDSHIAYYDVHDLSAGGYEANLESAILSSPLVLLVFGPVWKERIDHLQLSDDMVRKEFEWAMEHRKVIVPVFMTGLSLQELLPKLPAAMQAPISKASHVVLDATRADRLKADVRTKLVPLISPHLARYWQRRGYVWRRRTMATAAIAATFATSVGLMIGGVIDSRAIAERLTVRSSLPHQISVKADDAKVYLNGIGVDDPATPMAKRLQIRAETWIAQLSKFHLKPGKAQKNQADRQRELSDATKLFVIEYKFSESYLSESMWLSLPPDSTLTIQEYWAFLVSNNTKDGYLPKYRQLQTKIDTRKLTQSAGNGLMPQIQSVPISLPSPNAGERLLVLMVLAASDVTLLENELELLLERQ